MIELVGKPAPNFLLTDLQGQQLQLSQLHGTPILLIFFKSTCPWCQIELPKLGEAFRRHPDIGVQIIGIVVGQDDESSATRFAQEKNLDFRLALDTQHQAREAYPLQRVPTVVLIDRFGNVQRVYEGSAEQLTGIVEQTVLASARGDQPPDYHLVGNGCGPD